MQEIPYGDWITAVLTITYLQFLAMRKWWGWPLGLITQAFWIYITLQKELYGFFALSIVMTLQFAYGWYNSRNSHAKDNQ